MAEATPPEGEAPPCIAPPAAEEGQPPAEAPPAGAGSQVPKTAAPTPTKKATKSTTKKPGFYQTNVKLVREFDFRMSNARAKGLACGPSKQVRQHHLVLPSDHPAAAPMIVDEVATIVVAKLLEKGVALKVDNRMEQSVRSIIAPGAGSPKLAKATTGEGGPAAKLEESNRYDGLIATLEKDSNSNSSPEKQKALEALRNAKKTNSPLKLEELSKIVEVCAAINFIDEEQAKKLVDRMQELGAITAERNAEILKAIEGKFVNGKIQVETLRVLIEEGGAKKN